MSGPLCDAGQAVKSKRFVQWIFDRAISFDRFVKPTLRIGEVSLQLCQGAETKKVRGLVVATVKPFIHPQDGSLNPLCLVKSAKRGEYFSAVSRGGSDRLVVPQSGKELLDFRQQL